METKQGMENSVPTTSTSVSFPQPAFVSGNIPTWLTFMEIWFDACQITDDKIKCSSILLNLPTDLSQNLLLYKENALIRTSYQTLKQELLRSTRTSVWHRHHQIFQREDLGNRTPSQLLNDMLRLSSGLDIDPTLLREAFIRKLPGPVQAHLIQNVEVHDLANLAKIADRIMETLFPSTTHPQAAQVSIDQSPSVTDTRFRKLEDTLERLTRQLNRLTSRSSPSRPNSRSPPSRPKSRSPTRRRRTSPNDGWCYFHRRFGSRAYKCTHPCSFPKNAHARK